MMEDLSKEEMTIALESCFYRIRILGFVIEFDSATDCAHVLEGSRINRIVAVSFSELSLGLSSAQIIHKRYNIYIGPGSSLLIVAILTTL